MNLTVRQIPVFAFPTSLKFHLGTKSSYSQILTLYSPYEFPIKYKIHCHQSAWDKYIVPTPEGVIPAQSSVDLVVTHKQPIPSNCNVLDKLKVVIQDPVTDQVIGKKIIESVLLPGSRDGAQGDDDFEFHSQEGSTSRSIQASHTSRTAPHQNATIRATPNPNTNNLISTVIIVVCAAILFMPTEPEVAKPSSLPRYLHVTHKIQLLAALLLGVFLCILVRS